jgi:hypothetical protein
MKDCFSQKAKTKLNKKYNPVEKFGRGERHGTENACTE